MDNMEYSDSLKHWVRMAPRKIRSKMFWALIADYAIWFTLGGVVTWFAIKVWN